MWENSNDWVDGSCSFEICCSNVSPDLHVWPSAIDRPDSCFFTDSEKSKIEVRGVELPEDSREPDPLSHRILELWVNGKCEIDDCLRFEWRRWDGSICLFDHADEPMPVEEVDQERVRAAVAGLCYWAGFKLEVRT